MKVYRKDIGVTVYIEASSEAVAERRFEEIDENMTSWAVLQRHVTDASNVSVWHGFGIEEA